MDLASPSDPFVIVSLKKEGVHNYRRIANTEVIFDNHSPDFTKELIMDYTFEEIQRLRLDIYDFDEDNDKALRHLDKHDYIGYVEFVLSDLVTANGQKLTMKCKNKQNRMLKNKGSPVIVILRCEEVELNNDEIHIEFAAKNLPKMDWFGRTDPYLQIYRLKVDESSSSSSSSNGNKEWMAVYKTEFIKDTYFPHWKPLKMNVRRLTGNGDDLRPILIKCYDWNKNAEPSYIGELETTMRDLMNIDSIYFRHRDKYNKLTKEKKYGRLQIISRKMIKKHAFVEYIIGGMDIDLIVAIDFTGSNGDPRDSRSLHYMGPPNYESDYLKVIRSVGRVLEPYDSDNMITVYGFGAKYQIPSIHGAPPRLQLSHCFPLTFNHNSMQVKGIDGVVNVYKNALTQIQLYGPTLFSEVIGTVNTLCSSHPQTNNTQHYTILLIITDGVINDEQHTINRIVEASTSPLSIIIVGVGNAGFGAMDKLDADEVPLVHSNPKFGQMKRDIVQFVPFNQFSTAHISALAKETLREVPTQVEEYMAMHNIKPLKPQVKQQSVMSNLYKAPSLMAQSQKTPSMMHPFNPYYSGN